MGALLAHVRSYYDALNTGDPDKVAAHFTDDAVHYYTRLGPHESARTIGEHTKWAVENLDGQWHVDHGAADHLEGVTIPRLDVPTTDGFGIVLAKAAADRLVLYIYPRTGVPGEQPIPGWDEIPGARGCTPQACSFRDHFGEIAAVGARVAGLSVQSTAEQREFA